jgi:hypothetical protein
MQIFYKKTNEWGDTGSKYVPQKVVCGNIEQRDNLPPPRPFLKGFSHQWILLTFRRGEKNTKLLIELWAAISCQGMSCSFSSESKDDLLTMRV